MLGDTNGDFKRKLLGKTEEKVRGYRSVALNHYCGNGYAFCVMISRKLGLDRPTLLGRLHQRGDQVGIILEQEGRFTTIQAVQEPPPVAIDGGHAKDAADSLNQVTGQVFLRI